MPLDTQRQFHLRRLLLRLWLRLCSTSTVEWVFLKALTNQGTQYLSKCMQEVSKIRSIKDLTFTPYHPICNRFVERWNGTLKSLLKRLCQDQPKQWHRLINSVLFAYREVPKESTGLSPFQLLYGRSDRGP